MSQSDRNNSPLAQSSMPTQPGARQVEGHRFLMLRAKFGLSRSSRCRCYVA